MSPAPMPLLVVRAREGAVGSTGSSGTWMSAMVPPTLCGGSDGLPHAIVDLDVLDPVGADADDRRRLGRQRALQGAAEGGHVGGALPAEPVQRGGVREVEPVGCRDVLDERVALR